ncbi:MAG: MarR family transcriptional regulator [Castellaniella sp.]|jgi:DNA-binding MarR family transcriptional regulator|uniref:MarR family winged helix-turn-helix transcriptional regulator n=1 Tax=Castellaniella sp. TaxID=1955812 RepID=UPI003C75DEA9
MVKLAKNFRLVESLGEEHIGLEARAQMDDHLDVRMWLRLLACSAQIERQIRLLLRVRFATSLPRFDYLAQLDRHPDGLRMSVLSRHLMVTGGNVTGLTDQLVKDGMVKRIEDPEDRRSWRVLLSEKGRAEFARMAAEHEQWLTDMFRDLPLENKEALYEHLGHLRVRLAQRQEEIEASAHKAGRATSRRKTHD